MKKEDYGEEFHEHLLAQYKVYVEMADRVSERRVKANQFYISLLSALLAILSFVVAQKVFDSVLYIVLVAVAFIGIVLCALWWNTINSYKQLNKLKFMIIHEMEAMLPFACYDKEWDIEKKTMHKYVRLTQLEKYVPFTMIIPYFLLLLYSFYQLVK